MIRITLFAILATVAICGSAYSEEKPEAAAIKKEIAAAEAKLTKLRSELAKIEGEPTEFKDTELYPKTLKIGERGRFIGQKGHLPIHKIIEIIDDSTMIVQLEVNPRDKSVAEYPDMIAKVKSTNGLADGQSYISEQEWRVVGTSKIGKKTMMIVREGK